MPLNKNWRELLELLNSNEVEYLVVGAFAVAFHGFSRYTADLDLFVRPTPENADRAMRALAQFGFGNAGMHAQDFQSPGNAILLGVKPNRVDLVTGISGVTFEEAWALVRRASWREFRLSLLAAKNCSVTSGARAVPKIWAMRKSCASGPSRNRRTAGSCASCLFRMVCREKRPGGT